MNTTDTTVGALYGAGIAVILTNSVLGLELIGVGYLISCTAAYFRSKGLNVQANNQG